MTEPRAMVRPLVLAALLTGGAIAVGAPVPHSLLLGSIVLVAVPVLWLADADRQDPPPRPSLPKRRGTRRELAWLSWSYSDGSRGVPDRPVRKLEAAARRRLLELGHDPDDLGQADEVERLLGPVAYAVLIARTVSAPVPQQRFAHCLDAVEGLDTLRRERARKATTTGGRA